ncbi:hypothetical protein LZG04_38745 [Saccharothrix sp. S26]|uniref:hypothetical protein n=1 Tax=Saccharothrix sp. S26 TaxID=2907215 RepID=UPI001F1A0413|nr:hypothetical protein [Saccharothrix sp. S26]MCE7000712.1 hypothetical protein [Saccharothrix sp. S26]
MKIARTAAALVAAAVTMSVLTPSAHALVGQTCTLTEKVTYSPPLTNTPQTVTFTVDGTLTACTNRVCCTDW